ncbi:hypothetical protein A6C57_01260 [Fibrella sp. ES10-3-2-2]|nr:hypothetical protein A6C57_01260 [Fibrella sp. ES10-3-2-2]
MITHDLLLSLGFVELPNRPQRYAYKGWTGRLNDNCTFVFHGLSLSVTDSIDLKYLLMLIDYNENATVNPYPFHEN